MEEDTLNEEEINIAFLGEEFVQKLKLKLKEKRNKRKISIGIFILFLVVGKVI